VSSVRDTVAGVADTESSEKSGEIEVYGELGLLPKVGVKVRLARTARLERVIDSAVEHAELDREQFDDRLADADDQVRDVVFAVAFRAGDVDDDVYVDVLGRLIAGALDSAQIDELAFVTSEITKLEPVHLRALFGFFWFGREGEANADADLSPADAAWATNRYRADREIAHLLKVTRDTASQVLLRLDRDGFIHLNGGPAKDGETTSGPRDWAGRVLSMLFPTIKVEFRNSIDGSTAADDASIASATGTSPTQGAVALSGQQTSMGPDVRERRAVTELEAEIKKIERQRHLPGHVDIAGGDLRWLATLKRRLRRVDPDNPWAYDD